MIHPHFNLKRIIPVNNKWRPRGGYSYFYKDLASMPGHVYDYPALGNDAENTFTFHSMVDLPASLQLDVTFRYVHPLPTPYIPDYLTFDTPRACVHHASKVSASARIRGKRDTVNSSSIFHEPFTEI
jgi:hypothetical protein